jgi:hypothetical protein
MSLAKAVITNTITQVPVEVQFNPEEYSLSRQNNYAVIAVPGLSSPLLQFVSGELQTLDMELFVDTSETHESGNRRLNDAGQDVREISGRILRLLEIEPSTHAPPPVVFAWGNLTFNCVLTKATQRFVLFTSKGIPLRARLQVTFAEMVPPDLEAKGTKRETADYSQVHVVGPGEELATIAYRSFGRPDLWRPIALINDIDDPASLQIGRRLRIPRLPFTDPDTGEVYR